MVDGILFDKLSAIAKALKKNNQPFGGIQVSLKHLHLKSNQNRN